MADETTTVETSDAAAATAPAPKKQRAPRRSKAAVEVAVTAQPAKTEKAVKKRAPKATEPTASVSEKPAKGPTRKGRAAIAKPVKAAAARTPVSAADEMADLLQLEEENKRLRQALAEKLRAENTSLRKRLGLA